MKFKEIISIKKELPDKIYIKYLERVIKILLSGETTLKNSNGKRLKENEKTI